MTRHTRRLLTMAKLVKEFGAHVDARDTTGHLIHYCLKAASASSLRLHTLVAQGLIH